MEARYSVGIITRALVIGGSVALMLAGCGGAVTPGGPAFPGETPAATDPCVDSAASPSCVGPAGVVVIGTVIFEAADMSIREVSFAHAVAAAGDHGDPAGEVLTVPGLTYRVMGPNQAVLAEGDLVMSASRDGEGMLYGQFTLDAAQLSGRTAVEVMRDGDVVAAVHAGPSAPVVGTVSVDAVSGLSASWDATDPDGDDLEYTVVVISADGSRQVIAIGLTTPAVDIDDVWFILPGADIHLLVYASDGLNVGSALSEPFSLADLPPELFLDFDDTAFATDRTYALVLDADAWDPADAAELPPVADTITWTSDIDGLLATGRTFYLNGATMIDGPEISVGTHTITVAVVDSAGNGVQEQFTLEVT